MRIILALGIALLLTVGLGGCGNKSQQPAGSSAAPPAETTPPPAAAAFVPPADLDQGPRASAAPVDEALAAQGAQLFTSKTCATCHGFGKKIQCPDLKPVAGQRTEKWMIAQVMHPDVMTKQDPTSIQLMKQYTLQMPNMNLTEDQAKALVEYIKKNGK
ncbi:MAG TPA: cytochrome c [Terriglobales bacterium]|nr:cytochrome c [Terriglobales bacterium]